MKLKLSRHAFTRFWDVHAWSGVIGGLAPTFVGALVLCVGWAFAARDETAIWWQGLGVAGVAMLLVPITATRWSDAGLFGSGHRLGAVVGVDVALLLMSFALLGGAAALRAASVRSPRTAALKAPTRRALASNISTSLGVLRDCPVGVVVARSGIGAGCHARGVGRADDHRNRGDTARSRGSPRRVVGSSSGMHRDSAADAHWRGVVTAALSRSRLDVGLRIVAAIVGTLPVAVLASACLARFLPLSEDARFAIGFTAAIPLWITAMCFAYVARSGVRAWLICLLTSAALAALVYGVRQERAETREAAHAARWVP